MSYKFDDYNGEPGCLTAEEINKMYRHYWDPTTYWQCNKQGAPALRKSCPTTMLFSDKFGKCVHYIEWEWTEPTPPPSVSNNQMNNDTNI